MSNLDAADEALLTAASPQARSPGGAHVAAPITATPGATQTASPAVQPPATASEHHDSDFQTAARNSDDPCAGTRSPSVAVKVEDEQPADSSPRAEGRTVSTKDIQLVQNLIERCMQLYMSQREVVTTLHTQAEVEPGFTGLVWQKLEEQNSNFFQAYYTRLKLKDQILLFNHLLDQQVAVVQRMQWTRSMQPAAPAIHQLPEMAGLGGVTGRGLHTSASAPMAAPGPLGNIFGDMADNDRLNQSSGLGGPMGAAPSSPPLFVSEVAHSSSQQGISSLGVVHMSSDNLMGLGLTGTSPVGFPGASGDPAIPHVFSMSDIDRHLDFGAGDEEAPALDFDDL